MTCTQKHARQEAALAEQLQVAGPRHFPTQSVVASVSWYVTACTAITDA